MQKYFLVFLSVFMLSPIGAMDKDQDKPFSEKKRCDDFSIILSKRAEIMQKELIVLEKEQLKNIKELLQEGLDVNPNLFKIGPKQKPAICAALEHIDVELVKLLLGYGVDVNACDEYGFTALDMAIFKNNAFLIEYLLQKGANPNISTNWDTTSLSRAVFYNNANAIKFLIQYNACVDDGMVTKLIKRTTFNLTKEYYSRIKTVLLLLNRYNQILYNNHDLSFMILSHLPEYHCHAGLYKQLKNKHVIKPFALSVVDGHIGIARGILQTKRNEDNKNSLELLPSIRSLYEKLLNDSAELNQKYPHIASIGKDNLALRILKNYKYEYKSLIPEDVFALL